MAAADIQRTIERADALQRAGQLAEAIALYRTAIAADPQNPHALNNLANALKDAGQLSAAADGYRRVIAVRPDVPELHFNLGTVLADLGAFDEAIVEFQTCLVRHPNFADAHRNLGSTLRAVGRLDEAIGHMRIAGAQSDLLYASHFSPSDDPAAIGEQHRAWGSIYSQTPALSHGPRRRSGRIRVGYVSPDFSHHPVGRFMLPILEGHDHEQFEIYCYSDICFEDEITRRARSAATVWRSTWQLDDEQLAQTIYADQIDVLIDLTMHMRGCRLGTFARRPASVQATYLAYASTTGLPQIDYRISDPYLDPINDDGDGDASIYTEKTVRLPATYWCYAEPNFTPVNRQPRDVITFGCLNGFQKITEPMLRFWGKLLHEVQRSRLILHCPEGKHRERVLELLNVSAERVRFEAFLPFERYMALQSEIDIALDPFPYGGGTTTCDALWCGTPVVTMRGRTAVSRGGLSILSNIGLPELVATNVEEYLRIAKDLATDRNRLTHLHATTRERLRQSPLMNCEQFVSDFEAILKKMISVKALQKTGHS